MKEQKNFQQIQEAISISRNRALINYKNFFGNDIFASSKGT